jgi:site-specific DNA-cytosine methylase
MIKVIPKPPINVLSLFDGMSCGRIALERAGIRVHKYFSSEVKDYAIKVADIAYPQDTPHRMGDITKLKASSLPQIDLLIGGSPCQDFSQANRTRAGHTGTKSGLFYEYVRLLEECNPRYFLLENVRMKKEHESIITGILGVEPITINSELVGPQLRHRLYWTNIPFKGVPSGGVNLNDVLECGYSDRKKARTLLESDCRVLQNQVKRAHRYFNTGFSTLIFKSKQHYAEVLRHFDNNFRGLTAAQIDIKMLATDVSIYEGLRYMTNREREACQTVPAGYTDTLSHEDAACVLGDGWTVDVIAHILRGIND